MFPYFNQQGGQLIFKFAPSIPDQTTLNKTRNHRESSKVLTK